MNASSRWLAGVGFGFIVCVSGYAEAQPPTPLVYVNCGVDSLQDAVDIAPASALIKVSGTCAPVVLRHNVTLSGSDGASIVAGPSDGVDAVTVPEGLRVTLMNLTLVGGDHAGLSIISAEVGLNNVRVERGRWGISVWGDARVNADSVSVTQNVIGVDSLGGWLTFRRSTIADNGDGTYLCEGSGGITVVAGALTLEDSTIRNNRPNGLCLEGAEAVLLRSSVTRNVGSGGGIQVIGPGTVSVTQSSITRNYSSTDGGGIALRNRHDGLTQVTVTNSTIAFNSSGGKGGGLSVAPHDVSGYADAFVVLNHTTVVGNTAVGTPGIWSAESVLLRGSLVSGNRLITGGEGDCGGPGSFSSLGWNLLTTPGACPIAPGFGDVIGVRPLLGAPATFGVTEFIPLLKTSPGRGVIPVEGPLGGRWCATGATADQRGVARPVGTRCDMGSVEQ